MVPKANFDEIAVRALQNPDLFKYEHFRQAALAVGVGVVIQLIVQIPVGPKSSNFLRVMGC
jgi:hypothetical protein